MSSNNFKLRALLLDLITLEMIHTMGALFVDDTDLSTWRDGLFDPGDLWRQTKLIYISGAASKMQQVGLSNRKMFLVLAQLCVQGRGVAVCKDGAA
jgi:hypothetical protein